MSTNAVAVDAAVFHAVVYGESAVGVERVAEDYLLGAIVHAEFGVFLLYFLHLLQFVAAIDAQSGKHAGKVLREVVGKCLEAECVVEIYAQRADIGLLPHIHGYVVGFLRAEHTGYAGYPLVRHGAHRCEIVFHGEVHIAGAHKLACSYL